ncbi:uncharacterized protein TrAtP1_006805 [Trichoderma atroviride]|uniref:uncharacterized protein n=1 Tax=Hypocrea atroviridis TaxID=63577 RepID=UPI00331C28CF|nr:hypothetical protein TrAtP1_006805 [Trichoderma atroviride]
MRGARPILRQAFGPCSGCLDITIIYSNISSSTSPLVFFDAPLSINFRTFAFEELSFPRRAHAHC